MAPETTTQPAPRDLQAPPQNVAIWAQNLSKRYGETPALSGTNLEVGVGQCFALLGPNGAGKTTTVSILTTLIDAGGGEARVMGYDIARDAAKVRERIGIVFQESCLDPALTPREHLDLQARIYRIADRKARTEALLRDFGLGDKADRRCRTLSGGERRRLEIARGMLHAPPLLFLDEPTVGLDVSARAALWDRLRDLRDHQRTTLFLTTHSMEEAEALADTVGILDGGRIVAAGRPRDLKAALGGDSVWFRLERAADARDALARSAATRVVLEEDGALHITITDAPRHLAELVELARPYGILEIEVERPTLEQVFLHHTGRRYPPRSDSEAV